jgi:HAD superfamily hydrolase (TIGR01509 family)
VLQATAAVPRAVLFDMDGVLLKSEEAWFRTVEAAGVRFRGSPVTREDFTPTFGQGTDADLTVFGLSCTPAELDHFYAQEFPRHLGTELWVNPDARPLLDALHARGVGCAVVTNTVGPLAEELLRRAGLREAFASLATADRVAHAKPAPDLVLLALRDLSASARDAVMVGDSRFDRAAAQAAGVRFIGLGTDGDARVEHLSEVLGLLPRG